MRRAWPRICGHALPHLLLQPCDPPMGPHGHVGDYKVLNNIMGRGVGNPLLGDTCQLQERDTVLRELWFEYEKVHSRLKDIVDQVQRPRPGHALDEIMAKVAVDVAQKVVTSLQLAIVRGLLQLQARGCDGQVFGGDAVVAVQHSERCRDHGAVRGEQQLSAIVTLDPRAAFIRLDRPFGDPSSKDVGALEHPDGRDSRWFGSVEPSLRHHLIVGALRVSQRLLDGLEQCLLWGWVDHDAGSVHRQAGNGARSRAPACLRTQQRLARPAAPRRRPAAAESFRARADPLSLQCRRRRQCRGHEFSPRPPGTDSDHPGTSTESRQRCPHPADPTTSIPQASQWRAARSGT